MVFHKMTKKINLQTSGEQAAIKNQPKTKQTRVQAKKEKENAA